MVDGNSLLSLLHTSFCCSMTLQRLAVPFSFIREEQPERRRSGRSMFLVHRGRGSDSVGGIDTLTHTMGAQAHHSTVDKSFEDTTLIGARVGAVRSAEEWTLSLHGEARSPRYQGDPSTPVSRAPELLFPLTESHKILAHDGTRGECPCSAL